MVDMVVVIALVVVQVVLLVGLFFYWRHVRQKREAAAVRVHVAAGAGNGVQPFSYEDQFDDSTYGRIIENGMTPVYSDITSPEDGSSQMVYYSSANERNLPRRSELTPSTSSSGGMYYAKTNSVGDNSGRGGSSYAVVHESTGLRESILNRIDSVLKDHQIGISAIDLGSLVAEGQGGKVYRSTIKATGETVAVKVAHVDTMSALISFREEAALLVVTKHECVTEFYGICLDYDRPAMVMEWCGLGSLEAWLRNLEEQNETVNSVGENTLYSICTDIASGMAHLESLSCVHRDLAARNVLLTTSKRAKICDLGRSHQLDDPNALYESKTKLTLPIRWLSPEARKGKYSVKSDVWAFGVTVWEVFALGPMPYWMEGLYLETSAQVIDYVDSGKRLPQPPGCPQRVYDTLLKCWSVSPETRPNFSALVSFFQNRTK